MAKDKNHVYNICMWTDQLPKGVIPEPSATLLFYQDLL